MRTAFVLVAWLLASRLYVRSAARGDGHEPRFKASKFGLTELVAGLSAIGTCAAAFISLFSLYEVRAQREASYRPDVVIAEDGGFYFDVNSDNMADAVRWSKEMDDRPSDDEIYSPELTMKNLGLGTARGIKYEMHFEAQKLAADINNLAKTLKRDITVICSESENFSSVWVKQEGREFGMSNSNFNQTIEFLTTVAVSDGNEKIHIPSSWLYLFGIFWNLDQKRKSLFNTEDRKFSRKFSIKLRLSFSDIGQKKYVKLYDIKFIELRGIGDVIGKGNRSIGMITSREIGYD